MVPLKTTKADLIGKYKLHLKISFILSISLLILAFKFSPMPGKVQPLENTGCFLIPISDTDPTYQKPKVPDPPKAPEIIAADLNDQIDDVVLPDVSIDQGAKIDKPGPPINDKPVLEEENIPYYKVEFKPEIVGGLEALYKKLHYTEIARKADIEGTVVIELVVDKDGNPTQVVVVKKLGGGLDDIALNAVKDLKFTPGIQSGKPVKVKMNIPIKFVLK